MEVAALGLWILTATGGATLAVIWVINGGPRQYRAGLSRIPPSRLALHAGVAGLGLGLWVLHLAADSDVPGWLAVALLPVAAALGALMLMTWLAGSGAAEPSEAPAERHFPTAIVVAHGVFAVLTLAAAAVALLA